MAEPSEYDDFLAEAMPKHGKVALPVYLDPQGQPVYPVRSLGSSVHGHVHIELSTDGIAREVFHTIVCNGAALPSLALAVYESLFPHSFKSTIEGSEPCTAMILQADPMMINYYGHAGSIQHISLSEILQGKWPPSFFQGKIVLVGVVAHGIEEGLLIPFTTNRDRMPGVEVHAHILNNLLDGGSIRPVPAWILLSSAVLLVAVSFISFFRSTALVAFFLWMSGLLGVTVVVYGLFSRLDLWVSPGSLWASMTAALVISFMLELRRMYLSVAQARREWEESFNTIDDAIIIQDGACKSIRTNKAADEMLGDVLVETLDRRCEGLSFRSGMEGSATGREGAGGRPGAETEEVVEAAAGRYYEVKSLPREDGNGRFCGAVHVVRDITQKKKVREEQLELQRMLVQAQKMEAIGTLAGGIAHDFNNILAAIVGYTELVCYSLPADQNATRSMLEQVLKASERARDLIMQILTFSRRAEYERKIVHVTPILKEGMKLFRTALPKSIEVRERLSCEALVDIDPTQMYQVLMNLCTNAYHAMKETGGILEVSLETVDLEKPLLAHGQQLQPGGYVRLTVSDSGYGISQADGEKIFEPYFTTKVEGEGTGLGLAIVLGIARDHGGLVTFESERGEGASFSVYFPLAKRAPREFQETVADGTLATGSGNILLIDDNPQMVLLVKQMLERLGYQVETRMSPTEAYDAFRARPNDFDLVMTDLDMPAMTGMELAERLLQIRPEMAIILSTGYCEPGVIEKALAIGIKEVVRKPFHASALSRLIAGVLAGGKQSAP
jgi:PAS domain S-box-containing protein